MKDSSSLLFPQDLCTVGLDIAAVCIEWFRRIEDSNILVHILVQVPARKVRKWLHPFHKCNLFDSGFFYAPQLLVGKNLDLRVKYKKVTEILRKLCLDLLFKFMWNKIPYREQE